MERFSDLPNQIGSLLYHILKWIFGFISENAIPLLFCMIFMLILVISASHYRDYISTRKIDVLVGPSGGSTEALVHEISEYMETQSASPWKFWVTQYILDPIGTDGYEENRESVSKDNTGRVIGFTHDGFGESKHIRILLPLDRNCLHILVTRDFLTRNTIGTSNNTILFKDIAPKLEHGRIFLGPYDSGTRRCAEYVLEHYGLNPGQHSAHGIADWHEMRSALHRGFVDVAFYGGPQHAPIIESIVKDDTCRLVGLDNDRDAIIRSYEQLLPDTFEANSYVHGDFCPTKIDVFGSRRVLVCSSAMSDRDAFYLAGVCQRALQHRIPEIQWANVPNKPEEGELKYPLHPAAVLIRDGGKPSEWPESVYYALMTAGLWCVYAFVRWLNKLIGKRSNGEDVNTETRRARRRRKREAQSTE